jgi:hypothetical protein
MPKYRKDRFYYRNGQLRLENRQVKGQLHGLCRTWYYNGQLAEELRYRQGKLHGLCRGWDENGRLLGSFNMEHGTGRQFYWHENGNPKLEINSLNGKFFGRMRLWLRDGTLVQETYYISNVDVPRGKYLKAARQHPEWPQHEGQPAGKVARNNQALKLKEHELFIQALLKKPGSEARQWLSRSKNPQSRSLARFRTAKAALQFVEALYAAGAETVIAAVIYMGKYGKQFADHLLAKLPQAPSKRKVVRRICLDLIARRDGAMLPDEKDIGESYLILNLE